MQIELSATRRTVQGTGASRRLRHAGRVPGILYGGAEPPLTIELDHNELYLQARREAFHASIITLSLDGQKQQVLLRAINMHPYKSQVQHVDFQRVHADQKIHMKVPLHFLNAEVSPAVKEAGAVINHVMNEIQISCLPADLPEFIEVDLAQITVAHSIHARELKYPKGSSRSSTAARTPWSPRPRCRRPCLPRKRKRPRRRRWCLRRRCPPRSSSPRSPKPRLRRRSPRSPPRATRATRATGNSGLTDRRGAAGDRRAFFVPWPSG